MTSARLRLLLALLLLGTAPLYAQGGGSPEARAAREAAAKKQLAVEAGLPKLQITEEILPLAHSRPHHRRDRRRLHEFQAGHLFVYSRTGKGGSARGGTAAELFEFDQNDYKFVKEWLPDNYAASFAHSRARRQGRQCLDRGRRLEHDHQVDPNGDWSR